MNATTEPRIFTVHAFRFVDGKRHLCVHYVAGTSSKDAELRIVRSNAAHLDGQCYITTDEHENTYGSGCKLYTNRITHDNAITEDEFRRWIRGMTRERFSDDDGENYPAAFRRMHVPGARKARELIALRFAA